MGKVYSTEKVFDGKLPGPGDHDLAGRELIDRIAGDGAVSGAMIYGSTAFGRADERSDLDVLVTYAGHEADRVLDQLQHQFSTVSNRYGVSIEPHLLEYNALANPLRHRIDPLFADQLREIHDDPNGTYDIFRYDFPLENLRTFDPSERRIRSLAMQYAGTKAGKFAKALATYAGLPDLEVFQRALEVPAAIGRKAIPATDMLGEVDYDVVDKQQMIRLTRQRLVTLRAMSDAYEHSDRWPGSADSGLVFSKLVGLNDAYSGLLMNARMGGTDREEYDEWLRENYLDAVRLARAVSYDWSELIRRIGMAEFTLEPYPADYVFLDMELNRDEPFDDEEDDMPPADIY